MIFRFFTILLVIAIIIASVWLGSQPPEAAAATTVENMSSDLGYSARKAVLVETGVDGLPMYTVTADVVRQRAGDGVDFERVHMSLRDQSGQVWTARAEHGQIGQDTSKVELTGNVHVNGLLPGSPEQADLATEKLDIDTRADILDTEEPVVVNWAGRQLKSRGVIAAMKERRLLMESNVHGTFLP
jgi:LPS export ABC transporter protein LptC